MPREITKSLAKDFFESLSDNEEHMGEQAALSVTLSEFGYAEDDFDTLAEMAEVLEEPRHAARR